MHHRNKKSQTSRRKFILESLSVPVCKGTLPLLKNQNCSKTGAAMNPPASLNVEVEDQSLNGNRDPNTQNRSETNDAVNPSAFTEILLHSLIETKKFVTCFVQIGIS
ncbi:hypothetical protein DY000_02028555 [Brassica cretica]|uniref:Uncharacterized protein n=1 Tax=Brassica cretica TaxID=69181 RepID=A0ABQ7DII6_BRACR|nr:hypothetical protein DY000_02028555 [Brassica cretica]